MFPKHLRLVSLLFLAVSTSVPALATPVSFSTILSGANEVPPTGVSGTGSATFTLDGNSLAITLSFLNLTAPPVAGHIHCCAPLGTNAIVAVPFVGLPASTSGSYTNTVDLSLASTYTSAFINANGGTVTSAEAAFIAGLNSGNTYANLHTPKNPGGEIRGQISPVPEPSSLLLLGTGLAGIVQAVRRRVNA